jgi:hypothetical protein
MKARAGWLALGGVGLALVAQAATWETIEVSAPIFPDVAVLYAHEGSNYPATAADQQALVDATALTYEYLRDDCAAHGYAITLTDGGVLTAEQLATNYDEVARCSYEQHSAKPYWIPQVLIDVDVCARVLGGDWHLLSEADVAGFGPDDFAYLSSTLSATLDGGAWWGGFYFSPRVFLAASDGGLVQGDLSPDAGQRVSPLPPTALTSHLEAGLSLRCLRRTP